MICRKIQGTTIFSSIYTIVQKALQPSNIQKYSVKLEVAISLIKNSQFRRATHMKTRFPLHVAWNELTSFRVLSLFL